MLAPARRRGVPGAPSTELRPGLELERELAFEGRPLRVRVRTPARRKLAPPMRPRGRQRATKVSNCRAKRERVAGALDEALGCRIVGITTLEVA